MAKVTTAALLGVYMTLFGGLIGCGEDPNPDATPSDGPGVTDPLLTPTATSTLQSTTAPPNTATASNTAPAPTATNRPTSSAIQGTPTPTQGGGTPTPGASPSTAPTATAASTQSPSSPTSGETSSTPTAGGSPPLLTETPVATPSGDTPGQSSPEPTDVSHTPWADTPTTTQGVTATSGITPTPGETPTQEVTATPGDTPTQGATPTFDITPPTSFDPSVTIISPREGEGAALVTLSGELSLEVSFVTANFLTREPGTCPEDTSCGQVYAKLDGDSGDQAEQSYNALDWLSPIVIDFSVLDDPSGLHTITLYLQNDDGTPVLNGGVPASDEIQVSVDLTPELSISLPDGSPVRIANDPARTALIPFVLSNWTLAPPNSCGEQERCGHLYLNIDGDDGNEEGQAYNNRAVESPAEALFTYVEEIEGEHTITLSLRDDQGQPVIVNDEALETSIRIDAQETDPELTVISPDNNSQVVLDSTQALTVRFIASGYTLAAPGTCDADDLPDCGYVTAKIDGNLGDKPQRDYNALAFDSPITVDFSVLEQPFGAHSVKLRLHRNDGTLATVDGQNIEEELNLLVVDSLDPIIYIVTPSNGDEVTLGSDPDKTVAVNYNVDNFDIRPPGTCEDSLCGHLYAYVDGPAGNIDGQPYNNIFANSNSGLGETYFDALDEPTGAHRITLSLRDDNGDPILIYGSPVEVSVDIETVTGFAALQLLVADGDVVRVLPDANQTVLLPYRAQNFIVVTPGTCSGEEDQACGYIQVEADDTFLNDSGSNPAEAHMSGLKSPTGQHKFRLSLYYNDGEAVLVDGLAVSAEVDLTVQSYTDSFVRVVSPQDESELVIRTEQQTVPVAFLLSGYLLGENKEDCTNRSDAQADWGCGYLKLNIDGEGANLPGTDYNAVAYSQLPIIADFSLLTNPEGLHQLTLSLYDHADNQPVLNSLGLPVEDVVDVITTLSDNPVDVPQDPILSLLSPTVEEGEESVEVTLNGDWSLELYFSLVNYTLLPPGTCTEADGPCGHLEVKIDGSEGNQVGRNYNAQAWQNPALADFSVMDIPEGIHTVLLTLVDNDGIPVFVDNQVVSEEVVVNVDIVSDISITLPSNTDIPVDNSELRRGQIPFQVANFSLKAPGTCEGDPRCGHAYLYINEAEGNAPASNYNSLVIDNPAVANFGYVDPAIGTHTVRIALRRDNGLPFRIDGEDVEDSVLVNTQETEARLTILSPENGAQVPITAIEDPIVIVTYAATQFTLAELGTCPEEALPDCGFVLAKVDGDAGNQPGFGYNSLSYNGIAEINLDYVDEPTGYHTVRLELFHDDGTPYMVDGQPLVDEIEVFTTYFDEARIRVLTPAPEELNEVPLGTDELRTVPITYQISNFTLREPGQCGSITECGQLHVRIDGDSGNATDRPYNNIATVSPTGEVDAYFAYLDEPEGPHTLNLSLKYDDGSPVLTEGQPVQLNVYVTTIDAVPTLQITGLSDGDHVQLSPDVDDTVFVTYLANHFSLREPGTCNGDELDACGYVEVSLDGLYNGSSSYPPAQVRFGALTEPTGEHTISLRLKYNNGSDVLVGGEPVESEVTVLAQPSGEPFIQIFTPIEGADVTMTGDELTVYLSFVATNVTLAANQSDCSTPGNQDPGTCAYIVVNIDGEAGNQPRKEYNNLWSSPLPAEALFIYAERPEGPHTVTLTLYDVETDLPIISQIGVPAAAEVNLLTTFPPLEGGAN